MWLVPQRLVSQGSVQSRFAETRFAETLIITLTRYLTLTPNPNNPNPNPNFGESGFGESGRHPRVMY